MSLPKTYKALQQKEKGKPFEMIDVEMKQPEKRQVVVKVLACGGTSLLLYSCLSDVSYLSG
jgi:D-arabinose 1-dehydrogenase-like Zn-dependent alcohol dehydrogenase